MEASAKILNSWLKLQHLLPRRGGLAAFMIAVGLTLLALFIRLSMAPVNAGLQYLTFFPAVTLAAVIAGFWPGMLATLIGMVFATAFFTPPFDSFSLLNFQTSFWSNVVFACDGLIVCSSIEAMHRYHQQYLEELAEARMISSNFELINRALRDSKAFSQSVFDSRRENVAVLDENGIIISVNQAWRQFAAENQAGELFRSGVGVNYLDIADECANGAADGIRAVMRHELEEFNLEYPCHSPLHERWFSMRVTPLVGERLGVLIAHENITQRKSMEKSLRHLATIVESSEDAIVSKNLLGEITSWNQGAEYLFGYTREEALGQSIFLIVPEERRHEEQLILERIARGFSFKHFQTVCKRRDGSLIDVSSAISLLRDTEGKVLGASVVSRDISEQKEAEQELRIAATAFEAHEGIVITDAANTILRANRGFCRNTGYALEELLGQNIRLLKSNRHPVEFYQEMWQTIQRDGAWQGEIWNRRKNGEVYPEWLTISAVKNRQDVVTHYVGTHTDISTRKAAEDEIKHLAFYDPLTRLPNRRLLLDRLRQALINAARQERIGALMFLDLDNFKTLNDTHGHDKGDLLLQQVAERLQACVREADTVARLGGDEFVVVLENLDPDLGAAKIQAESVGRKILAALSETYQLDEHEYRCTSSIGVTLFGPHNQDIPQLLMQADRAMYQAKAAGRNDLCFHVQEAVPPAQP